MIDVGAAFKESAIAGYLNTPTFGLPPVTSIRAMEAAMAQWRDGGDWTAWEEDGDACRMLAARLLGVDGAAVAVVPSVSAAAGLIAASLPVAEGANVVLHDRDFASTIFPWMGLEARDVELRLTSLHHMADAIDRETALVAVSLVQSADGALTDVQRLSPPNGRLFVDATQALGGMAADLEGIDYLAAAGYKWLLGTTGLAYLYVAPARLHEIEPWWVNCRSLHVSGEEAAYGPDRTLASDARRLDASLAWLPAAVSRPGLELLADVGIPSIAHHNLALAREFADAIGEPPPSSPIVSVRVDDPAAAVTEMAAAGVTCAARAGGLRFGFHLYNGRDDVAAAAEAVRHLRAR
jgi:selenocysteine lyase/cysteine desulfurase